MQEAGILDTNGNLIQTLDDLKSNSVEVNSFGIEKMEQEIKKLKRKIKH